MLLAVSLVLAACGGTQKPADTKAPAAPAAPAQAAKASAPAPAAAAPAPAAKAAAQAPAAPAKTAAKEKIKISVPVVNLAFHAVYLAKNAGFFGEENLEVEIPVIPGAGGYAALTNNEVQAMANGPDQMFSLIEEGTDKFLAVQKLADAISMDVAASNAFVQKRGVTSKSPLPDRLKALSGQWGMSCLQCAPHMMHAYLAKRGGLVVDKDANYVKLASPPAILQAMKAGQVDGFMLSAPISLTPEVEGWGTVFIPYTDVPEFANAPHEVTIITKEMASKNPDLVRRITRALGKAQILMGKEPEKAAQLLAPSFQPTPVAVLTQAIKHLMPSFHKDIGLLNQKELDHEVDLVAASGMIKSKIAFKEGQHWTNQFLK